MYEKYCIATWIPTTSEITARYNAIFILKTRYVIRCVEFFTEMALQLTILGLAPDVYIESFKQANKSRYLSPLITAHELSPVSPSEDDVGRAAQDLPFSISCFGRVVSHSTSYFY
jgi:hypothetical protein